MGFFLDILLSARLPPERELAALCPIRKSMPGIGISDSTKGRASVPNR